MPGFHTKMRKAPERLCAYFLKKAKLKRLKPKLLENKIQIWCIMPGFHTKMRKAPERLCAYFLKRAKLKVLKPNWYEISKSNMYKYCA